MLWIPAVFSDGALFQHSASLTISGRAKADGCVEVVLQGEKDEFCHKKAITDHEGLFSVTIPTPHASFCAYRLWISDGETERTCNDWLFGELWMGAGQSNMELSIGQMPDRHRFYKAVSGKKLRFYYQESGDITTFPERPDNTVGGSWCTDQDALFTQISACGTAAVAQIYDFLNSCEGEVPVGLIHCCMGATFLEGWLPQDAVEREPSVCAYLAQGRGHLPWGQGWNGYGGDNYRQPFALFNRKVAALIGVQLRGIFWYQGESNVGGRPEGTHYYHALLLYQQEYQSLFLADGCDTLPVLCVQLYPFLNNEWYISEETECRLGYLNEAFVRAERERPDAFAVIPIYDLPPRFAPFSKKVYPHPIHPMHKYALGCRLGKVAAAKLYGAEGIKTAATVETIKVYDGAIWVTFRTDGYRLEAAQTGLDGFYICGENGVYQEAEAKIVCNDTVRLSHPDVLHPLHAAYRYEDMAQGASLSCGGIPVAPFASDKEHDIYIAPKPWLCTTRETTLVQYEINDTIPRMDFFLRPLWHPLDGSELCRDTVYCQSKAALRIAGEGDWIGAYVQRYPGSPLDLHRYRVLQLAVFHFEGAALEVFAQTETGSVHTFPVTVTHPEDDEGWTYMDVALDIADCIVERLVFRFNVADKKLHAVNIDSLHLRTEG